MGSEARLHHCPGRVAAWRRVPASWPQGPRQHRDGMPKSHSGLAMHVEHRTSWDASLGRHKASRISQGPESRTCGGEGPCGPERTVPLR